MSAITFIESLSADPVERAIAARVMDILKNPRLTQAQRRAQVADAQRELLEHRRQKNTPAKPVRDARQRKRGVAVNPIAARRRELAREPLIKP